MGAQFDADPVVNGHRTLAACVVVPQARPTGPRRGACDGAQLGDMAANFVSDLNEYVLVRAR